jgi:hypothetical protein
MSEHTIVLFMKRDEALDLIADAINDPDSIHDMVYAVFRAKVPDWAEHGWELRAVAGVGSIIVTARRKT